VSEITSIKKIHTFPGHPAQSAQFWPAFLTFASLQIQASSSVLLIRRSSWEQQLQWPEKPSVNQNLPLSDPLFQLADNCLLQGQAILHGSDPTQPLLIGLAIVEQATEQPQVIIFKIQNTTVEQLNCQLRQLQLLADAPAVYQQTRVGIKELGKRADLTQTLELLLLLNQQEKFIAAAMTVPT